MLEGNQTKISKPGLIYYKLGNRIRTETKWFECRQV